MMDYSADEKRALDALNKMERPTASAEARDRIRTAFMQAKPTPRRRPALRRLALPLAAAAAAVLLYIYGAQPEGRWVVADSVAPESIQSAATDLSPGAGVPKGRIATGDEGELELHMEGTMRIRLLPGTEMVLPAPPKRWFDREMRIEVAQGEIYGTTGGRSLDFPLVLQTAEATCRITGTTFAAFRTDEATCFCLWSGAIEVSPAAGGEALSIPVEHRVLIFKDGRAPAVEPISDMERMKLSMMHDAGVAPPGD